jgi:uncharacterized protein
VRLEGRLALVTGASTGIGAATARALVDRGARVVVVARRREALDRVAAEIGTAAHVHPADVSDADEVAELARTVTAELGTPDVLVNNAGAGRFLFIDETSPEELVQQMSVPFFAAFFVTRAFIEDMVRRGSGQIVNVNTPISRITWPGAIGYASARWAMRGFSEALRADLAGTGLRITEVVPAKVSSEYFAHNPGAEERIPGISRLFPTLTPEQTARAIVRGIERGAREVSTPLAYRLAAGQARLFPRLSSWLVVKTGARRPR